MIEALRHVIEAEVRKAGGRVGCLVRTPGGCEFRYDTGYSGPPVATSLPISALPTVAVAGAVPPFFAGLLPEGRRLVAVRSALKTSADDDFSLLLAIGHDTVGDVQVVPLGWEPPNPRRLESTRQVQFSGLMAQVLGPDGFDRVGLPGVQDKVSSAMISLPVTMAAGPFILKLNPRGFPRLVENEAFFLQAAKESELPTVDFQVVYDAVQTPGLLVRRFDRVPAAGGWRPLAQEDGCQVLRRFPADKYRVSSEELLRALADQATAPVVCARDLLRQLAFAYLSCNGDAHAKNFSIRQASDGVWEASPAYDLPSSHPYGDHSMALPINGKVREDIGRTDFLAVGAFVGLPAKAVHRVLDQLCDAAARWIGRLDELPFDQRRIHKLRRAISFRRERLGKGE